MYVYMKSVGGIGSKIMRKVETSFCSSLSAHLFSFIDISFLLIFFITVCFYVCKALLITGWVAP